MTKHFTVSTYELFARVEEVDILHAILTNLPFTHKDILSSKEVLEKTITKIRGEMQREFIILSTQHSIENIKVGLRLKLTLRIPRRHT